MRITARYFDGKTATPHDVAVFITSESFMIQTLIGKKILATWQIADAIIISKARKTAPGILGHKGTEEQIIIEDLLNWKEATSLLSHTANRASWIPASAASILGMILICIGIITILYKTHPLLTKFAANNFPISWENKIGEHVLETQFSNICASSGEQKHSKILAKLKNTIPLSQDIEIYVDNVEDVNALALPGNKIVILKGLITKSKTQEELLGVFAHELGHIEHRHSINSLVNSLGLTFTLSVLLGDSSKIADMLSTYTILSYSRDNESQADEYAVKTLIDAKINPEGLPSFFKLVEEVEGNIPAFLEILSTHPATKERISNINKLIKHHHNDVTYKPALSNKEWKELKSICNE